jgi:hypothetical protein
MESTSISPSSIRYRVNASAGRVHRAGVDTPESVTAIAEYAEDFIGVFSINYAAR